MSEPAKQPESPPRPTIFFDGHCVMCNTFVDLVLRADRRRELHFAPLRGETARRMLPSLPDSPEEWSMLYLDERGLHDQSDASLEVYRRLGGPWRLLGLLRWIPKRLRDPVYRFIARRRYRWFGQRSTCRMPSPEERDRFLP